MAEANPAPQSEGQGAAPASSSRMPTLFFILAVVNMLVVVGVGVMIYLGKQKEAAESNIDDVIKGESQTQKREEMEEDFIGKLIPLETFLVNVAGSRGRKLLKINMELEVDNDDVQIEIEKLKPKIRDIIIINLSSKTYAQISTSDGKEFMRDEIRDQVNLFLTKGKIKRVYFTEFIFN